MEDQKTLLTFPCDFTIKVFGMASDDFEKSVLTIIRQHLSEQADPTIRANASANGKYTALSITIHVDSKEQLDRIYQDLSHSKLVLMAL